MAKRVVVKPDGSLEFIYDDAVAAALRDVGALHTERASHVEPHPKAGWLADMRPSGGPILGAHGTHISRHQLWVHNEGLPGEDAPLHYPYVQAAVTSFVEPFDTRQEALDAELAWLREHRGL